MIDLLEYIPQELAGISDSQNTIPKIAKDPRLMAMIEDSLARIPTSHRLCLGDSRIVPELKTESVHLVLTSPPYWTLKRYREGDHQLGHIDDYEDFLSQLDKVWVKYYAALVPGGRVICVVGDVCLSRRKNAGEHMVVPLHASIQEHCRRIGFNNLSPIIWHKISNANYEVAGNSTFLGKPYEPNAVIKNDIEFILMQRKGGGYRAPSLSCRLLSIVSEVNHRVWFQQIWSDITGASTKAHPAPFPVELAERLIRMFSFVGDTVVDPFMGTGTTNVAAARCARNSIGIEIDPHYFDGALRRLRNLAGTLYNTLTVDICREEAGHGRFEQTTDGGRQAILDHSP